MKDPSLGGLASSRPPGPSADEPVPGRTRRRGRIAAFALALLVLQELYFRWLFPLPEVSFNRIDYSPLVFTGEHLVAQRARGLSNVVVLWQSEPDGFRYEVTLNRYGFRGSDFPIRPDGHRSRVLFAGDSTVEGLGADDDHTVPRQFERACREPVEALNLGVGGSGFQEHLRVLRDAVPLLRPEAVFLVVCTNDLPAPPLADGEDGPARQFVPLDPFVPRAAEVLVRLCQGRAVVPRFRRGPIPFFEPVPSRNNLLSRVDPPEDIDPAVLDAMRRGTLNSYIIRSSEHYQRVLRRDYAEKGGAGEYLRRIAELCRAAQARLIVVYVPYVGAANPLYLPYQDKLGGRPFEVAELSSDAFRSQQRHLEQLTRELQIPYLDLTDGFITAEAAGERLFWPIDGHCNGRGYGLIAASCARWWDDQR